MPQEDLAHRANIHVTYLSGIENGKRNPGLLVIGRLARALNVTIPELFSGR
jgi:transcriptional regulator with XRE-family HTH domain